MKYFVIRYNRSNGDVSVSEFAAVDDAIESRRRLEESTSNPELETVILSAEGIEQIRETHSRYFMSADYEHKTNADLMTAGNINSA